MWLFCNAGFFSAVEHFEDSSLIHVRARFQGDLEKLCASHGVKPQIAETPNNDYRWRMDFKREDWARVVKEEAENIDYNNFKNAVHDGTPRDDAYIDVWTAMRDAQERQ